MACSGAADIECAGSTRRRRPSRMSSPTSQIDFTATPASASASRCAASPSFVMIAALARTAMLSSPVKGHSARRRSPIRMQRCAVRSCGCCGAVLLQIRPRRAGAELHRSHVAAGTRVTRQPRHAPPAVRATRCGGSGFRVRNSSRPKSSSSPTTRRARRALWTRRRWPFPCGIYA